MKRAVVIVAAGSGQRMGQPNKALLTLGGEPALVHSIRAAAKAGGIASIIVVTRGDLIPEVAALCSDLDLAQSLAVVAGGETRTDSVAAGVAKAAALGAGMVAVHDAARPLVTADQFDSVFALAERTGAAILAAPVVDTLKRVNDAGVVESTVDRTGLWSAQTPQAFRTGELIEALATARAASLPVTDEAGLYEAIGKPVTVVRSDPTNLKLTYPSDLELASYLFERRRSNEETEQ